MDLGKLFGSFKFRKLGKVGKTDFGVLKVAYMVAALDGEVSESEFKALDTLAKKCRGYTPKIAAQAIDEALRSAGYLMLLSKREKDAALVAAFVREAKAALPNGFAYMAIEDVRRAVATWVAMGMSDGDYSAREKKCIEALRKLFAELKVMRADAETLQALDVVPGFLTPGDSASNATSIALVTRGFVSRVEDLFEQYGDSAAAAKLLQELVAS